MSNNINPKLIRALSKIDKRQFEQLKNSLDTFLAARDIESLRKQVQAIDQNKLAEILASTPPDKINSVLSNAKNGNVDLSQIISQIENLK